MRSVKCKVIKRKRKVLTEDEQDIRAALKASKEPSIPFEEAMRQLKIDIRTFKNYKKRK